MISVTELRSGTVFEDPSFATHSAKVFDREAQVFDSETQTRGTESAQTRRASGGKQYYLVLSYEHIKRGRGSGTIKVKVRNLETGAVVEKSFMTGARVTDASLSRRKVQYLYRDGDGIHLMDMTNYEQATLRPETVGNDAKFLKEGLELNLLSVEDKIVGLEFPKIAEYKIVQTGGSARGNTVGATYKDAVLENNLVVKVPLFIKTGQVIRVDTRSGQYVERAG